MNPEVGRPTLALYRASGPARPASPSLKLKRLIYYADFRSRACSHEALCCKYEIPVEIIYRKFKRKCRKHGYRETCKDVSPPRLNIPRPASAKQSFQTQYVITITIQVVTPRKSYLKLYQWSTVVIVPIYFLDACNWLSCNVMSLL